MRYPAEQKAETHEKILATAARSFREHGSERNGIGQVMKELGLTKGGFYRHFDSKSDLYAAALARAFEELGNRMIAVAEAAPKDKRLRAMIEDYLSAKHLNTPGTDCPLAALAPEIARQPLQIRKRINQSTGLLASACFPIFQGALLRRSEGASLFCFPGWLAHWSLPGRLRTGMAVSACWLPRGHSIWRHLARKRAKKFGL
jgi:TetR/AcrR family transcriptional repressor of nem operon